jgi:hypothetical protein
MNISKVNALKNSEKILVALILGSIVIYYIATGEQDLKASALLPVVLTFEIVLIGLYIFQTKNIVSVFLLGFVVWNLGFIIGREDASLGSKLQIVGEMNQFILGIYMAIKAVKESVKNKDWEMYGTLISLELMFPILYRNLHLGKELLVVYYFALPFVLGIVMFNENLWDKYTSTEKKILTYILISAVAEVLFISVRLI